MEHTAGLVQGICGAPAPMVKFLPGAPAALIESITGQVHDVEGVVALFSSLLVFSKLLWCAEARVRLAFCQQFICCFTIQIKALSLAIRTAIAALIWTLVPIKTKPLHGAQNNLSVLLS